MVQINLLNLCQPFKNIKKEVVFTPEVYKLVAFPLRQLVVHCVLKVHSKSCHSCDQ